MGARRENKMLKERTGDGTWAGGLVVGDEAHASIFPLGSRPPGQGLVRETQLPRMDWSALLWTGKTVSDTIKVWESSARHQYAQNCTAEWRLRSGALLLTLNRKPHREDVNVHAAIIKTLPRFFAALFFFFFSCLFFLDNPTC